VKKEKERERTRGRRKGGREGGREGTWEVQEGFVLLGMDRAVAQGEDG
jgi:hypothetical protein